MWGGHRRSKNSRLKITKGKIFAVDVRNEDKRFHSNPANIVFKALSPRVTQTFKDAPLFYFQHARKSGVTEGKLLNEVFDKFLNTRKGYTFMPNVLFSLATTQQSFTLTTDG